MTGKYRNKKPRILAAALCVCIAAFLVLSFAYEIKEANHDCTGNDCPICAHIQIIENTRQLLSLAVVAFGASLALLIHAITIAFSHVIHFRACSPVQLKVKLNN